LSRGMSALCQKQTFRRLLDIIVGGQGCSSSWSITRETSPSEFLASGRRCCRAAGSSAHRTGADLSVATSASDRATRSSDITARLIGQWLSERLGQQFVIDNRPGGGGNVGTEAVVRAPADGYTLLLVGGFNATNATYYDKLNYNFIRDIAPVASIIRTQF